MLPRITSSTARKVLLAALLLGQASVLVILLSVFLSNAWVVQSTRDNIFDDISETRASHVVIVPGAGIYAGGKPTPALRDRLACALDLYKSNKAQKILVSGDNSTRYYDEVTTMRKWLLARGAAPADVVRDHAGFRTHDTMQRAAVLFGVEDATICTQRFHVYRSVYLAQAAGIDAVGAVADRREDPAAFWNAIRESGARLKAVADVWILRTEPRYWGPPEDLIGNN